MQQNRNGSKFPSHQLSENPAEAKKARLLGLPMSGRLEKNRKIGASKGVKIEVRVAKAGKKIKADDSIMSMYIQYAS